MILLLKNTPKPSLIRVKVFPKAGVNNTLLFTYLLYVCVALGHRRWAARPWGTSSGHPTILGDGAGKKAWVLMAIH